MSASVVEHRPREYLYTAEVHRHWVGGRWAAVERLAAALADDPVTRELPVESTVREPTGELLLRSMADLRSLAAGGSSRFDVVVLRVSGRGVDVAADLTGHWYGVRINVVCRSPRQAEAVGLAEVVSARLRRYRWAGARSSARRLGGLLQSAWFIAVTVMLIGLVLTKLLMG